MAFRYEIIPNIGVRGQAPRSFGPRKGTEGIIWHTDEGRGSSRESALATVRFQMTNPGSYNFIIYDGGVLLTVPYLEASGGTNPSSAYWAPDRYPHLKANMSPAAYADPNAYHLNVCFAGKTAVLSQSIPENMLQSAAELTGWVERSAWGKDNIFYSGHYHWQRNRSDPSQIVIDKVLNKYNALFNPVTPVPEPAPATDYQKLYMEELAKVGDLVNKLQTERARIVARDAHIDKYPRG